MKSNRIKYRKFFNIFCKTKIGKVQKADFTFGGAGNQWTNIDNIRYATWWNVFSKDWQIGDFVTFKVKKRFMSKWYTEAYDIHKLELN